MSRHNTGKEATTHNRQSAIGNQFGDYELLEEIARGGMGVVFKARQKSLNRVVALKMIVGGPLASPMAIERFRAEAEAAASIQHPNIVAIHEVGEHEGLPFFSMDYVAGRNLAEILRDGPLAPQRAARYGRAIAEAAHYAHQRGILHRDLKPANVIIDEHDQPRITDFGLAKRLDDSPLSALRSTLTLTGQVLGSPNFMAPEQAQGRHRVAGPASDVYSIGALLYHLLTGRPPFQAETLTEVLRQVATAEPVAPRLLNPSLPRDLETICLRCLEKEIPRRYRSAQELADDLGRFLRGEPILARPIGNAGKAAKWCRRNPRLAAAAGVALLSLLVGLVGVAWGWRHAKAQRARAELSEYVVAINLAHAALKANNPGRALELLDRYRPEGTANVRGPKSEADSAARDSPLVTDPRGIEWCYLWQQCQTEGEFVGRLRSGIRSLRVSPDGRWLAAGSTLGAVKAWNLATGEELALAPDGGVKSFAAFSPDSRLLLFTDQSLTAMGRIAIWNLQARQRESTIADPWPVGTLAFTADGQRLLYGTGGPHFEIKAVVLDFPSRKRVTEKQFLTTIDDRHGYDATVTPDGRNLIFSENDPDRRIGFWEFGSGGEPKRFPGHDEAIVALALSPDGKTLATAAGWSETVIKLWDVPSFRPLFELAGHAAWIASLEFSPDGEILASGSADQTIRLWEVRTGRPKRLFQRSDQPLWRVCFTPDGQTLFSGSSVGTIRRWSLTAAQPPSAFWTNGAKLDAIAIAPAGSQFAGIRNGVVHVGNATGPTPPGPVPELGTNNVSLVFAPDGRSLLVGTQDGEVQTWSLDRRHLLPTLRLRNEPVHTVCLDSKGRTLVVAQWKPELRQGRPCRVGIWDIHKRQERKSWTFPAVWPRFALSTDGRWLASGNLGGAMQICRLTDGSNPHDLDFVGLGSIAFSPDAGLLAAASFEGIVKIWEMPTVRELTEFRAHIGAIHGIGFSPDSRRLVTAGDDAEALRLWDVATQQEFITLERPSDGLQQIAFTTDGQQLTMVTRTGDVLCWRVPSLQEIAAKEKDQRTR